MCGINGYFQFTQFLSQETINNNIHLMNDRIVHRGPDEDGFFLNDNIGLAMRRLSIIDLKSGQQPIFNEDKSLVIVFNGEIYNFHDLHDELIQKGHKFQTHSDTEVIIHAYEEYGPKCLEKLEGMFAFSIYDINKQELFIARDRIGEKPLYYYKNDDYLLFGSELKSLMALNLIPKRINKIALAQYFELTYIPAPLTIYDDVYKLPAASYMTINSKGISNIYKYWDVDYSSNNLIKDTELIKDKLRSTLFKSVEQRMVSDVPIGAFLSGGIDSTIIVAILSKLSKEPINTFTIGFKEKEYDERNRAQLVADKYKTNHHVYTLDYDDAVPLLNEILNNMDEPFGDSSIIPTYMVSKYARQYVKVILTGDAGDELFAGYSKYLITHYSDLYLKLPKFFRNTLIKPLTTILPKTSSFMRKINKVISHAEKTVYEQRLSLMSLGINQDLINSIFKDKILDYSRSLDFINDYYSKFESEKDEITQTLYTDLKVVLEGDMLVKVDRASMLASLETRVPMLDSNLIDLAYKIPSQFKISNNNQKIILKETFKDLIPEELFTASKKGFAVPIHKWLNNDLKNELEVFFKHDFIESQNIFNSDIQNVIETLSKNNPNVKWLYYVFQGWYERNMI